MNPWQDDEDEQKQGQGSALIGTTPPSNGMVGAQGAPTGQAQGQQLSKGSAFSSSGTVAGAAPGSPAPKTGTSSGAWTNLNQYLEANRGAGATMAGSVTGAVQKKVGEFQQGATGLETRANEAIDKGGVKRDASLEERIKSNPVAVQQAEKDRVRGLWDASFKGPRNVTEFDGATKATLNTQRTGIDQDIQDFGSDAGKQRLARDIFKDPRYTRGEQTFDAFLMGTDGGATFEAGRKSMDGYASGWEGLEDRVGAQASAAETETNAAREGVRSAVGGARTDVTGRIDKVKGKVDELNKYNDGRYEAWLKLAQSADPAQRQQAATWLGLHGDDAEWFIRNGGNMASLASNTTNYSLGDLVNQDDVASLAALEELAGLTDFTGGYDFSKAGGSDRALDVRQDLVGKIGQGRLLNAMLDDRVLGANAQRSAALSGAKQSPEALAKTLGVTMDDLYFLAGGYDAEKGALDKFIAALGAGSGDERFERWDGITDLGVLFPELNVPGVSFDRSKANLSPTVQRLSKLVSGGEQLGLGDVASDAERQQWQGILSALGIQGANLSDVNNEGAAFRADPSSVKRELAEKRTQLEVLRKRAQQASKEKKAASQKKYEDFREQSRAEGNRQDSGNREQKTGTVDLRKPVAQAANWTKKKLSDERKKTDVKPLRGSAFDELERYLKGAR